MQKYSEITFTVEFSDFAEILEAFLARRFDERNKCTLSIGTSTTANSWMGLRDPFYKYKWKIRNDAIAEISGCYSYPNVFVVGDDVSGEGGVADWWLVLDTWEDDSSFSCASLLASCGFLDCDGLLDGHDFLDQGRFFG